MKHQSVDPPLKWHGGKSYLSDWIVGLMPPRCKNPNNPDAEDTGFLHYVEPYFGMGSVMLAMDPEGISEVANDIHGDLTNFWAMLQNTETFTSLVRLLEAVPFGEAEWVQCGEFLQSENTHGTDKYAGYGGWSVARAAAFFTYCRQSLAGRMDGFASITRNRTRRGMNEQVSAWLNCIEGLPVVHTRLKRVLILNRDALDVIRKEDGPRTLLYIDPPYLHETRATTGEYEHEMTAEDHAKLLSVLTTIKGRFLLSGYHSGMYDRQAAECGWRVHEKAINNHAAGGKTKRVMVEVVWCNF